MMAVLLLMLYMCVAGSITALPVDDDVVMVGDDSNAIEDSDVIDLSGLGPEAFTFPKNESGEL